MLRPEAWVLAGAYWLWCWPGRSPRGRVELAVLAAIGPLVWAAVDLWVTGDPLYSLHATSDLADELNRNRGLGDVPGSFVSFLVDTARPPVAAAAVVGAVLAWRLRAGRALHVPAALFAAGTFTFVASALAGLSVLPRYLTVPAVAVCLLAGYGLLGFTTLARGRDADAVGARRDRPRRPRPRLRRRPGAGRQPPGRPSCASSAARTSSLVVAPARPGGAARPGAAAPLTFPNYRLVPDARWILDLPRSRVGARSAMRRERGVGDRSSSVPRSSSATASPPARARRRTLPDPGFVPIARNERYAAYAACG